MKTYSIALIGGDGIGPEILREGKKVMDAAAEVAGITWQWKEYPYGADHWLKYRKGQPTLMSEEEMAELGKHDAVYFGAIGDPRVPDSVNQAGALLWMRFYFDQYINLRPAKLYRGIPSPLAGKSRTTSTSMLCARTAKTSTSALGHALQGRRAAMNLELKRALYKARFKVDVDLEPEDELAYQIGAMTGRGAERVIRYGFELARRKKLTRVTVVHKANVLTKIYGLWIETAERGGQGLSRHRTGVRHCGRDDHVACPAPRIVPGHRSAQHVRRHPFRPCGVNRGRFGIRPGGQHQPGPKGGGLDVRTHPRVGPQVRRAQQGQPRLPRSLPESSCWSIWGKSARPSSWSRPARTS